MWSHNLMMIWSRDKTQDSTVHDVFVSPKIGECMNNGFVLFKSALGLICDYIFKNYHLSLCSMQLWLWRLKNSVYCWQLSIMVISVRWWYWFPRGLLLNPGFVCLSWCFDLLRLAFTVDFHSNSCVNNHRILTASIKGNLEMFCLGEFCSIIFPFSFS